MTQTILVVHNYSTRAIELISNFIKSVIKSYRIQKQVRNTINELSRLNDQELRDIGLSRGDIYTVAYDHAVETEANDNLKGWV